jgi:hypothetical protein
LSCATTGKDNPAITARVIALRELGMRLRMLFSLIEMSIEFSYYCKHLRSS